MRVPDVRDRLRELACEHGIEELYQLADELVRRQHGRRAPVESATVTEELATAVRAYRAAFPEMSMHRVGLVFQLNQGRVSEILFGKRE